MRNTLSVLFTIAISLVATNSFAQKQISRKQLFDINMKARELSSVKIVEIEFPGGQKAPPHKHPCPVVGQIISGTCLVQVEGEEPQILTTGDTFYEPADTTVIHFDNNSETERMKFVAYYLTNGEQKLVEILPSGK